jgi:hypothetical protein
MARIGADYHLCVAGQNGCVASYTVGNSGATPPLVINDYDGNGICARDGSAADCIIRHVGRSLDGFLRCRIIGELASGDPSREVVRGARERPPYQSVGRGAWPFMESARQSSSDRRSDAKSTVGSSGVTKTVVARDSGCYFSRGSSFEKRQGAARTVRLEDETSARG